MPRTIYSSKEIVAILKKQGYPVLKVTPTGEMEDGEIEIIKDKLHIQINDWEGYMTVNEWDGKALYPQAITYDPNVMLGQLKPIYQKYANKR